MSLPISAHFTVDEFKSHDGVAYPLNDLDDSGKTWFESRLAPLVGVLEEIREACGAKPLTILSGYRSPAHNVAVGGAQFSQHMAGRAADITVEGLNPANVHKVILDLFNAKKIEIGGLGIYPGWVHVDIRPRPSSGHLAQWTGAKVGDESAT